MGILKQSTSGPQYFRETPLDTLFFKHPRQQGETYIEHFKVASKISIMSGVGAFFMMVHAFIPGINLFEVIGTYSTTYYGLILDKITRNTKTE